MGAGEGRHSRELARRGYKVIALERSKSAVENAVHGRGTDNGRAGDANDNQPAEQYAGDRNGARGLNQGAVVEDQAITWIAADMRDFTPDDQVDLILLCFLHQREFAITQQIPRFDSWLKPGGWMVFVGHSRAQLGLDVGGPRDPERLWDPAEIASALHDREYHVIRAQNVPRPDIEKQEHAKHKDTSIDAVVVAQKR